MVMVMLLSGCSVYMASAHGNSGVNKGAMLSCVGHDKKCILGYELEFMGGHETDGKYVETYRAKKPQAEYGYARAVVYYLLDVATNFYWELVGTSIESIFILNQKHVVIEVFYKNKQSNNIENIIIYEGL